MYSHYVLGCQGTNDIVHKISTDLSLHCSLTEISKFPNEELRLRIPDYGDTTFLVGSLSRPVNTRIIEYLLAADALKRAGCRNIIGILTWYPYSKQDKVFLPGEPLSAKVMASIFQTVSIRELFTLDIHNPSIAGYFDIPVINTSALPIFIDTIRQTDLTNTVVVSPDIGSIKNANRLAQTLGLPLVNAHKSRDLSTGQVKIEGLSTNINGKNILIFDDMIASGSTLIEITGYLKEHGANTITICCTHHLYLNSVQEKLDHAPIDRLIVTNSILKPETVVSQKLEEIDVSPVFIREIKSRIIPG